MEEFIVFGKSILHELFLILYQLEKTYVALCKI